MSAQVSLMLLRLSNDSLSDNTFVRLFHLVLWWWRSWCRRNRAENSSGCKKGWSACARRWHRKARHSTTWSRSARRTSGSNQRCWQRWGSWQRTGRWINRRKTNEKDLQRETWPDTETSSRLALEPDINDARAREKCAYACEQASVLFASPPRILPPPPLAISKKTPALPMLR